jgi:hypothetical protein
MLVVSRSSGFPPLLGTVSNKGVTDLSPDAEERVREGENVSCVFSSPQKAEDQRREWDRYPMLAAPDGCYLLLSRRDAACWQHPEGDHMTHFLKEKNHD